MRLHYGQGVASLTDHLVTTALLLLGIMAVAAVVVVFGRRRVGGSSSLELLDRLALDNKRTLYLVRVGSQVLILGAGDLRQLGEVAPEDVELIPLRAGWRERFAEAVKELRPKGGAPQTPERTE